MAIMASGLSQLMVVITVRVIIFKSKGEILGFLGGGGSETKGAKIIIWVLCCFTDFMNLLDLRL